MSDDILSRILILLEADSSGFTDEVNRTEEVADTSFSKIRDKANMMGAGLVAATRSGAIALAALTAETIAASSEIQNAASVAGISAEAMQYYAVGASQLGIEQNALGDILADTAGKMGEFAATEDGGLADFFENIAPKVGLTAEAFLKLKPPEALIAMVDAAEKANLSYEQTRFYLESFASDSTKLLPLLKNGGAGFKAYGDAAKNAGAILGDDMIADTNDLMAAQFLMEQQVKGLKNEIVRGVMPTIVHLGDAFTNTANDGVKFVGVSTVINSALTSMAKVALGVMAAFELTGKAVATVAIATPKPGPTPLQAFGRWAFDFIKNYDEKKGALKAGVADLEETVDKYGAIFDKLNNPKSSQDAIKVLSEFMQIDTNGNTGRNAAAEAAKAKADAVAKAKAKAEADAKQRQEAADAINNSYDSAAGGLKRQIDLLGKTTELEKFKYELEHGSLTKLAPLQKQNIENLARALDAKKHEAEYTKALDGLDLQINLQHIKFDLDKHMYELEQVKYKEYPQGERAILLEKEKVLKISQDYLSLSEGLKTAEEKRYDGVIDQLEKNTAAFMISNKSAETYAENMQNIQGIFDGSTILPGITSGISDEAGIEVARAELENKYLLEQDIRNRTIKDETALNDSLINLELDYIIRSNALKDQADAESSAKKKIEQQKTVQFFESGLAAMANSQEKYAKAARAAQKLQALYKIGVETKTAAISAYQWAVGLGGPIAGALAGAAAIAFGLAQAKAVMSDAGGGGVVPSTTTPSSASTNVTPIVEQPKLEDVSRQSTTVQIPADTLFTGRQMVDLLNEQLADGKKLNIGSINFIGIN